MSPYDLSAAYSRLDSAFVTESSKTLSAGVERIEHAVNQLSEMDVWWRPHESANAVGNLLLHLRGNVRQWIISGVGGQPDDRRRQAEFDARERVPKAELLRQLRETVDAARAEIERQDAASLLTMRMIQGFETMVLVAVYHVCVHFEGHAQEIVYIARQRLGEAYEFLWTPSAAQQGAATEGI